LVLFVALLLLQLPWMLRFVKGIAALVAVVQSALCRYLSRIYVRRQQKVSPGPLDPHQFQVADTWHVDSMADRLL